MRLAKRHRRYLDVLATQNVPIGDWTKGETQIVTDPKEFIGIERRLRATYAAQGLPAECGNVGVIWESPWFIFLNDPVLFPPRGNQSSPTIGAYNRVLFRGELNGNQSVFALLILQDGRILLNYSYRSPIRAWTLEGHGTIAHTGETIPDVLRRCVKDETGRSILSSTRLSPSNVGFVASRELIGSSVPVFLVRVGDQQGAVKDPTVNGSVALTPAELARAFTAGTYQTRDRNYLCADGYTAYAFLLARLGGHLSDTA
ncbi:MAG: hypothetical protein PHT12_05425 [Patescibacteria group bacterium]|nr:hypothetical protein [Patescibacteria group bacterium]